MAESVMAQDMEHWIIDTKLMHGADNVGVGCKCIHAFEKHYIDIVLTKEIDAMEEDIKHLRGEVPPRDEAERIHREKFSEMNKALADQVEATYVRDLKVVRDRFRGMPKCEQS